MTLRHVRDRESTGQRNHEFTEHYLLYPITFLYDTISFYLRDAYRTCRTSILWWNRSSDVSFGNPQRNSPQSGTPVRMEIYVFYRAHLRGCGT